MQISNVPSNSRCQKVQLHLNKFQNLVDISPPHWLQKMTGTLRIQLNHGRLLSQLEPCCCCLQSGDESCPQSEPRLAVQIAEALFVLITSKEEIHSAVKSLLKYLPSSSSRRLITEDFKFTQTIRIDVINSSIVTRGELVMKPGKLQRNNSLLWFLRRHVITTLHADKQNGVFTVIKT